MNDDIVHSIQFRSSLCLFLQPYTTNVHWTWMLPFAHLELTRIKLMNKKISAEAVIVVRLSRQAVETFVHGAWEPHVAKHASPIGRSNPSQRTATWIHDWSKRFLMVLDRKASIIHLQFGWEFEESKALSFFLHSCDLFMHLPDEVNGVYGLEMSL